MKRPLPLIGAATVYAIGIVIRYLYIFVWHPATDYRYSFMGMYYAAGRNFRDPAYVPNIHDTLVPPGMGYFIGMTRLPNPLDPAHPNLMPYFAAQLLLSSLVPLILGLIALEVFGRRAALLTIVIASLYFPFIDYAGYFLAEGPFLFFLVLAFWLMVRSLRAHSGVILFAVLAGLALGVAASFKTVALAAGLCVLVALLWFAIKRGMAVRRTILGGLAGAMFVLIPLSMRATRLNEGNFCLIANDWGRAFLLGHCGRNWLFNFEAPFHFGSSGAFQKGHYGEINVDFAAYDNGKIADFAFNYMRQHPLEACFESVDHVFDLAFNNLPWPSATPRENDLDMRPWLKLYQILFVVFLFFPACVFLYRNAGRLVRGDLPLELLLLMPLLALIVVAFVFVGEARYRVPFDGFIILLAVRHYCVNGTNEPAAKMSSENIPLAAQSGVLQER